LQVDYIAEALCADTAAKAKGYDAISIFTHDTADAEVLQMLANANTKYVAVRAAGYDNIDIKKAYELGIRVANVPAYSPYAVAEHAVALLLALNRKLIVANRQVHNHDFTIANLVGFDLHGKTAGIIGTGKIGAVMAQILHGFGCHLVGFDLREDTNLTEKFNLQYTDLRSLCYASDIITVHLCLNDSTKHIINSETISYMRPSVIFINTSRGAVVDTPALIKALEQKRIAAAGLDVYENEKGIFFKDLSRKKSKDPLLVKLLSLPNVLITPHQAFATQDALQNIAAATFKSLHQWSIGNRPASELGTAELIAAATR
jgi:D-lactate dehydrogenase